jgi:uncharacterized protein YybS (DUF2232 family)
MVCVLKMWSYKMIVILYIIYNMKKLLLITLISSGISFFYYYYNKNVKEEGKEKDKVDIRWNDEIIYI